uniref:Uncharacterized protein n=1 Tax=Firmicutes phage HS19 TaxID=3056397 RepID=A0AA50ACX1_9VIRU|nr:MAG: hypothetical protein [Firmicutes phage HS19]
MIKSFCNLFLLQLRVALWLPYFLLLKIRFC